MRKKHFWRLDTKSIVMFKEESSHGFYKVTKIMKFLIIFKELPLSEILDVKISEKVLHADLTRTLTHYFEIRTHTSVYYIGKFL